MRTLEKHHYGSGSLILSLASGTWRAVNFAIFKAGFSKKILLFLVNRFFGLFNYSDNFLGSAESEKLVDSAMKLLTDEHWKLMKILVITWYLRNIHKILVI